MRRADANAVSSHDIGAPVNGGRWDCGIFLGMRYTEASTSYWNPRPTPRSEGDAVLPKALTNLGNLGSMMKSAMELKGKMEELKETLAEERIEASSGGGMVEVVVNGKMELLSLKIDPEIIDKEDPEALDAMIEGILTIMTEAENAAAARGILTIDVSAAFNGPTYRDTAPEDYLVADRIHLAEKGSQVVAELLHQLGYEPTVTR